MCFNIIYKLCTTLYFPFCSLEKLLTKNSQKVLSFWQKVLFNSRWSEWLPCKHIYVDCLKNLKVLWLLLHIFRDHPKTIRQRFRSVFVISLLAPLYVWLWADGTSDRNVSISSSLSLPLLLSLSLSLSLSFSFSLSFSLIFLYFLAKLSTRNGRDWGDEKKNQCFWLVNMVYTKGQKVMDKIYSWMSPKEVNIEKLKCGV